MHEPESVCAGLRHFLFTSKGPEQLLLYVLAEKQTFFEKFTGLERERHFCSPPGEPDIPAADQ